MSTIWDRIWPPELEALAPNPKAFPMAAGQFPQLCENCGGHQVMMVYVVENGPYTAPNGSKVKWLDLAPSDNPNRPSVSGWYSGRLQVAPCPVCQGGRSVAWLERNCGLDGSDLYLSLGDFRALDGKAVALNECRRLLALNHSPAGFVTLHGSFGVGKSHLLKSLVNGFRAINVRARYAVLADLLADIRERFGDANGGVAVEDAIEQYRRVTVLCLDEVADGNRSNLTGWAKETVFRLLDARYNDRERVLTVLGTNVHPDRMTPEWGYLRSRMDGGRVIEVAGKDMRPVATPPKIPAPAVTTEPEAEDDTRAYDTASAIARAARQMQHQ